MEPTAQNSSTIPPAVAQNATPVVTTSGGESTQAINAGLVARSQEFIQQNIGKAPKPAPIPLNIAVNPNLSVKAMTSIADAMFTKGLLNDEQLKTIKFEAVSSNRTQEQIIITRQFATEAQVQQIKAEMYGIPFIDLSSVVIDSDALNKIPKDVADRVKAVAFEETSARIKVAMMDPLDLQKIQYLQSLLKKRVDAYYAEASRIQNVINTSYGAQIGNAVDRALEDIGVVDIQRGQSALSEGNLDNLEIEGAPVAKIVNMILDFAVNHHASDIHIEPREERIAVRFRIGGVLAEKLSLPRELVNPVVTRIKILANMKIDEHRTPQDNRFQVRSGNKSIDIRVSIMPAIYGEKVVMRLLERDKGVPKLSELGLRGPSFKTYKESLAKTQGIILVTGPTGSGKTVTLASSLGILNTQEVNILTLEDPVEIRMNGVTQVQVNPEVGLTFASGLRAFLRQDPDIIMVGEIRDSETANLAVQAALTGHLVLATLHTNSAAGALPRLVDLGVEPFLLSSTIDVVVGQRLVRTLCDECKQDYPASPGEVEMLHTHLDGLKGFALQTDDGQRKIIFNQDTKEIKLFKAVGCPKCGDTGYNGRIGIFEVMTISDKIGRMIMEHRSATEINQIAINSGMVTMLQDGLMKSLEGLTTVEEVLRVQNI